MLRNTFVHLPGVGGKTERRLWEAGVHTWEELFSAGPDLLPRPLREAPGRRLMEECQTHYTQQRWHYFDRCLPGTVKWRAYDVLKERVMYVDIETNGFDNAITVIGIYDGRTFHAFVADENLEEALTLLESASLVVTFNGTGFDMPIIRARFPYHLFNHVHIDLMWPLRRLGFRGGLKRIEKELGITRSAETSDMSGWDAVYLWRAYQQGSQEAKERLLKYNEEDVRNLEPLMTWVYHTCKAQLGITLRP